MHSPHPKSATDLRPPKSRDLARGRSRGSLLIIAMLLTAVIGISIVSYLNVTQNAAELSNRTFYDSTAMNLAEMGLEEALYCYNNLDNVAALGSTYTARDAWGSGWIISSTDNSVIRRWSTSGAVHTSPIPFTLGPNVTADVRVYCSDYNPAIGNNPSVVAAATITPPSGPALSKFVQIDLRRRSLFGVGLVSKANISWSNSWSNATTAYSDSWDPYAGGSASYQPYAVGARKTNGNIATTSTNTSPIDIRNGSVYGTLSTGLKPISYGGSAIVTQTLGATGVDPTLLATDFFATFPLVRVPTPTTTNNIISSIAWTAVTYPQSGDLMNTADSTYYYTFGAGATISNSDIVIKANCNVVFLMTSYVAPTGTPWTWVKGIDQGAVRNDPSNCPTLTLRTNASLKIYTNSSLDLNSGGVVNGNPPINFQIYGTNLGGGAPPAYNLKGNGGLRAAIYAPNASVNLNGGATCPVGGDPANYPTPTCGDVYGSIAGIITFNGVYKSSNGLLYPGPKFHYDESLGNAGAGNPFGIKKWAELTTAAQRAAYATQLNF